LSSHNGHFFLGEHFFIPPKNTYEIKNVAKSRGELSFMLLKNRPMFKFDAVDTTQQIDIRAGSLYQAESDQSSSISKEDTEEEDEV